MEAVMIHIKLVNLFYKSETVLFSSSVVRCQVSWKATKSIKLKISLKDKILFSIKTMSQILQPFLPSKTKYVCIDIPPL